MSVRYGGFGSGYGAPYWPTGKYSSPGYYNQALQREGWAPDWANMDGGVMWPPQGVPPMTGPAVNRMIDGTGVTTFDNPEPIINDGALQAAIASGGEALSGAWGALTDFWDDGATGARMWIGLGGILLLLNFWAKSKVRSTSGMRLAHRANPKKRRKNRRHRRR